jgi:hypothetical protein
MSGSPTDQRHYEPQSAEQLMNEFPGWLIDKGTSGLWYARGPAILSGEDLTDLRDKLIRWKWKTDNEIPACDPVSDVCAHNE